MQNSHKALIIGAIGLVLILLLIGIYLRNRGDLIQSNQGILPTGIVVSDIPTQISPVQDSSAVDYDFQIIGGNVYKIFSDGRQQIVADTADYSSDSIEEFTQVFASLDKSKICFLGQSIVPLWLYLADSDGGSVQKLAPAVNCIFSNDSSKIIYNNHTTDVSPVDVFLYDLRSSEKKNLTKQLEGDFDFCNFRMYSNPIWIDESNLSADYSVFKCEDSGQPEKGSATINIQTGQIQ